ncbi:hypothetical protein [Breoghania sp. L-A4]|uniref:hypothetical protein n=1 Tax=Breoghania sp. L-A4 TaxID=2304600 RepID=UPI000E35B01E|nr:hypothetical protein [Breoghania sp. L-A4]AXS41295.1 hypothetical protein D1F64_16270 [Breoghania sp. L-A4]
MIEFLKILHFIAIAGGVGASLSGLIVMRAAKTADPQAAAALRGVAPRLGAMGAHSIILLWITGPLLLWLAYDRGAGLGPMFHAKMASAVALTLVVASMRLTIRRMKAGQSTPLLPLMPKLGIASAVLGPLTVALAVLAFS